MILGSYTLLILISNSLKRGTAPRNKNNGFQDMDQNSQNIVLINNSKTVWPT